MHRLLIGALGLAALVGIGLLAALFGALQETGTRAVGTSPAQVITKEAAANGRRPAVERPHLPNPGWRVVRSFSAHSVMVVDVQTDRLEDAKAIAVQIVEPVKRDYMEIMIYFRSGGPRRDLPDRRVQWTPRGGYVETGYDDVRQP